MLKGSCCSHAVSQREAKHSVLAAPGQVLETGAGVDT